MAGAAVLVPIPYTRTLGYELEVQGRDGRISRVRLSVHGEAQARRRAELVGRQTGAKVSLRPVTERTWGSVYAAAAERAVHIRVEFEGKSDAQVADEVRGQLQAAGYEPQAVEVVREGGEAHVGFEADDGSGRRLKVVRTSKGEGPVPIELGGIDDARAPGMTDEQLREKIVRQLRARGASDVDVVVDDDRVLVKAHRGHEAAP